MEKDSILSSVSKYRGQMTFFNQMESGESNSRSLTTGIWFLQISTTYGETGKRDTHLEMRKCELGGQTGTLHFIHFSSSEIFSFLELANAKGIGAISTTLCATGGGAQLLDNHMTELKMVRFWMEMETTPG